MSVPDGTDISAEPIAFAAYTDDLARRATTTDGVQGIVLAGSASASANARRDEWSDHDFYALFDLGAEDRLRRTLPFLPLPDRIALIAGEGGEGFSVLYDDGHLLEFGAGTTAEFQSAKLSEYELLVGDESVAEWAAAASKRGASFAPETAADAAGLALVKLLVGFGRAKRGELLSGGAFVRGHAVAYLTLAIRQRIPCSNSHADRFDPLRRFEDDYPEIALQIAEALDAPVMDAARQLLGILRDVLEAGWSDFPSRAADVVAARLR